MLQSGAPARTARTGHMMARRASATTTAAAGGEATTAPQPAAGASKAVLLRRSSSGSSSREGSLTLDNKNPSKLVVKPDGNILWEMPAEGDGAAHKAGPRVGAMLHGAAEMALVLAAMSSGVMGIAVAATELTRAADGNYCVTSQHLAKLMASTVSSSFAGTVAGLAYAPLLAARLVCGRLARPVMVLGAAAGAVKGVMRCVTLRGMSPANLLKQLQEAALTLGGDCLEAVERVAVRAAASPRWRRAFVQLGGIDALLRLLSHGVDAEAVRALVRALGELLKEDAGQLAFVADGGVPFLVHGLGHPDAEVSCCCSEMLGRLAQAGSPAALRAVREAGGVPAAVELLADSDSPAQQLHLLTLVAALARGSEEGAAELLQAALPSVLLHLVASEPLPRTQVKEAALSALHVTTTTSAAHFAALRALPSAQDALAGVAAAYGGAWYSSKPALSGLNARLAAAAAADAAAAAAAAAPIAGELEELVEAP